MGKWYVIANIPTYFEKGGINATETYTWNEEENRIDVVFQMRKKSPQGKLKEYPQKAFIHNKETKAEWRVQFFWPVRFAYLILELANDYSYTIVGVPSRKYVWIMARQPKMEKSTLGELTRKSQIMGFDISKLQKVEQIW